MPARDKVLIVVREWVEKAENDLKTAAHTLKLGRECPTDTVCFHAQQCVEKYLKAALVLRQTPFSKTHDVGEILLLLPQDARPALTPDVARKLTVYATAARYPGWGEIALAEARRAVAIARRVRKEVRASLPKEVLRRRKP